MVNGHIEEVEAESAEAVEVRRAEAVLSVSVWGDLVRNPLPAALLAEVFDCEISSVQALLRKLSYEMNATWFNSCELKIERIRRNSRLQWGRGREIAAGAWATICTPIELRG